MKNDLSTKAALGAAASLGIGAAAYAVYGRPWHLRWGTTGEEQTETLPGDEFTPENSNQVTHAITIGAPAGIVWRWLVQIGQGRGGFYSYDYIENLFGLEIHNTDRIEPALQEIRIGDFVRSAPTSWLGGRVKDKTGWFVVRIDPERALVLRDEIEHGTWSFILKPLDGRTTRLIVRARGPKPHTLPMKIFSYSFFEPAHFIMERKMLLTLKRLSERDFAHENTTGLESSGIGPPKNDIAAAART